MTFEENLKEILSGGGKLGARSNIADNALRAMMKCPEFQIRQQALAIKWLLRNGEKPCPYVADDFLQPLYDGLQNRLIRKSLHEGDGSQIMELFEANPDAARIMAGIIQEYSNLYEQVERYSSLYEQVQRTGDKPPAFAPLEFLRDAYTADRILNKLGIYPQPAANVGFTTEL